MSLFKLIFNSELMILIRSGIFRASIIFFILLSGYAIYYGNYITTGQLKTIESVAQESSNRFEKLIALIDKDTLPNVVGNRVFRTVANPPSSLAAFSLGQRDILPYYANIRYWALSRQSLVVESANPEKLLAGNFDLAFVIIQLLPLLIIGISYNLLSVERESGTLSMVLSYPITSKQLLLFKLITRLLLILLMVTLILFSGIYMIGIKPDQNLFEWYCIVFIYILFWFSVMYFINTLGKSSSFNALSSLGIWILLVFLLPAAINIYVGIKYPSHSKQELTNAIREGYEKIWEKYDDPKYRNDVAIAFGKKYPQYVSDTAYNWSDKYMLAQFDNYDGQLQPLFEKYQNDIIKREELTFNLGRFNPVIYAQLLMNQLAKTDMLSHQEFQQNVASFHSTLKGYFYSRVFSNATFKPNQFDGIPKYVSKSKPVSISIQSYLLYSMIIVVVLISSQLIMDRRQ